MDVRVVYQLRLQPQQCRKVLHFYSNQEQNPKQTDLSISAIYYQTPCWNSTLTTAALHVAWGPIWPLRSNTLRVRCNELRPTWVGSLCITRLSCWNPPAWLLKSRSRRLRTAYWLPTLSQGLQKKWPILSLKVTQKLPNISSSRRRSRLLNRSPRRVAN